MVKKLNLTWMDDLKAMADLCSLNVMWESEAILFSKIDLRESQHNGARLGDPLVTRLISDYKQGMKNGDTFPRIVVHLTPTGYVILGGNQRCASISELIDEGFLPKSVKVEAYVVQTSDNLLLEVIARSGNVGHGGRSEFDERVAHAVYSVRQLGLPSDSAAKLYEVSRSSIDHHIKADKKAAEYAREGVNVAKLPRSTILAVGSANDIGSEIKLAQLANQHQPPAARVAEVAKTVKASRSSGKRLLAIKDFERELTAEAHRKTNGKPKQNGSCQKVPRRPRRDRLVRDLERLANWLDTGLDGNRFDRLTDLQVSDKVDEGDVRRNWSRIQSRMKVILQK